jgi:hypothetical protein
MSATVVGTTFRRSLHHFYRRDPAKASTYPGSVRLMPAESAALSRAQHLDEALHDARDDCFHPSPAARSNPGGRPIRVRTATRPAASPRRSQGWPLRRRHGRIRTPLIGRRGHPISHRRMRQAPGPRKRGSAVEEGRMSAAWQNEVSMLCRGEGPAVSSVSSGTTADANDVVEPELID